MEESESAYNMPEPLFRRFEGHIYLKPDIQQWLEWGSQPSGKGDRLKIHPLVANFVAANMEKVFYSPYDSEEPPKYAVDPRGWEQISDIIYDNDGYLSKELVENKVGKGIAAAFMQFAQILPITVQDVVDGNFETSEIPMMQILSKLTKCASLSANTSETKSLRHSTAFGLGMTTKKLSFCKD